MKPIRKEFFVERGFVSKIHGNQGELKLALTQSIKLKEWVFLEFNKKPVPFFLSQIKGIGIDPIIKLKNIDTVEQAKELVGKVVLVRANKPVKKRAEPLTFEGYVILDEKGSQLGTIKQIEEMPQQLMATVESVTLGEFLVPLPEDWIIEVNTRKKQIVLAIPEGLLPS